jgi:RNase P subunit RPR2
MSINKKDLRSKIKFLLDFALSETDSKANNPYIKDYIQVIFRIAKKINYRLPSLIHRKVCKNCFCIRTDENTIYRIENFKKNGNINKYLKLHCKKCGYIKKINLSKLVIFKKSDKLIKSN